MKSIVAIVIFLSAVSAVKAQTLYTKAFGNPKDKAVIFLHGGPGYNAVNFEATTANKLAENGFYVIVYDRRGEGRSVDKKAIFTFEETFYDLNNIYKQLNLQKATLLGHSFGGIVAILYAEKYPEKVNTIILAAAPVSLQETFKTILTSSALLYEKRKDTTNLNYISLIENMDKSSLEYSSYCFGHAIQNGFYFPKKISEEARLIYSAFKTDTLIKKYASQMTYGAPQGFWRNEKYTSLDLTSDLKNLLSQKVDIYGLYGKDDGLYSAKQVTDLQSLLGVNKLRYFDDCSHNVFIDQQTQFIEMLKKWLY